MLVQDFFSGSRLLINNVFLSMHVKPPSIEDPEKRITTKELHFRLGRSLNTTLNQQTRMTTKWALLNVQFYFLGYQTKHSKQFKWNIKGNSLQTGSEVELGTNAQARSQRGSRIWNQFHHCNNYNSSEIGELRSFHLFFLFGLCDSYAKKVTWCNKGLDKMAW